MSESIDLNHLEAARCEAAQRLLCLIEPVEVWTLRHSTQDSNDACREMTSAAFKALYNKTPARILAIATAAPGEFSIEEAAARTAPGEATLESYCQVTAPLERWIKSHLEEDVMDPYRRMVEIIVIKLHEQARGTNTPDVPPSVARNAH